MVGGGAFDTSTLRQAQCKQAQCKQAQCKQAQDKFFVFSLTIATTLYKYMHIYLWTALRIMVFERGICGGVFFRRGFRPIRKR